MEGQLTPESIKMASDCRLRVATILSECGSAVGVAKGGRMWKLEDCLPSGFKASSGINLCDMEAVIKAWPAVKDSLTMQALREDAGTPLAECRVRAPIVRPKGTIMCIGKNYADHVKEVDTWQSAPGIAAPSVPQHPIVFTKASQSVIGTGASIFRPAPELSTMVDYEAELGVVIGKEGKAVSEEDAMGHVFGYTIMNDVTARDMQKRHQQFFLGKSCDTFCPMGPWIVPASELDAQDLSIQCWVNEELRQNGRTSSMIFSISSIISILSRATTLLPGDIIATGTPSGVGSGFKPPKHLNRGDVVRIRIEGIGEISNPVQ